MKCTTRDSDELRHSILSNLLDFARCGRPCNAPFARRSLSRPIQHVLLGLFGFLQLLFSNGGDVFVKTFERAELKREHQGGAAAYPLQLLLLLLRVVTLPLLLHVLQELPPTHQELLAVFLLPTVNLGLQNLFQLEPTGIGKLNLVQQIKYRLLC